METVKILFKLTINLIRNPSSSGSEWLATDHESPMITAFVLRTALRTFSAFFGGLGVFATYLSCIKPALGLYAVLFIAIAMATLWLAVEE